MNGLVFRTLFLTAALGLSARVAALDVPAQLEPIQLEDDREFTPVTMSVLPDFMSEVEIKRSKTGKIHIHGLLSTINYCEFDKCEPDTREELLKLDTAETGFQKTLDVRLFLQPNNVKAPLAVTLLGFAQPADDKPARAFQKYLYDSGCHVLSFDSLIRNNMNEATGHGVAGNFIQETRLACKIIEAVLAKEFRSEGSLRQRVGSVRLLGLSYGGLLAAACLREPEAQRWPIDRVLILSTPINMQVAAKRLDAFAREDKPFFGMLMLSKLLGGYTPKNPQPSEEEEALMRAGIGHVFHGDLQSLAKSNISRYSRDLPQKLKMLDENPDEREFYREMLHAQKSRHLQEVRALDEQRDTMDKDEFEKSRKRLHDAHKVQEIVAKRKASDIGHWNFNDYVFLLLKPYWKLHRGESIAVTLPDLLNGAPNFVQAFVSADDPLNDPAELARMAKAPRGPLTVIPHGGHLGYTGTQWCKTLVTKFFSPLR